MSVHLPVDYNAFLQLSARIGADVMLTQGAGGNTSIKSDGITWVKASGTWLSDALNCEIMVPVHTAAFVAALRANSRSVEIPAAFVVKEANTASLRPSIETAFHCLLPQRVVVHFHGINTLVHLVCADRNSRVAAAMALLPDLRWQMIDYLRPGAPLAAEIDRVLRHDTEVLFLANHGVIVAGPSVVAVSQLVDRLVGVFNQTARAVPAADARRLAKTAADTGYVPAGNPLHHVLGTDPSTFALTKAGVLMPDQAIFLGRSFSFDPGELIDRPALLIVENAGVLYRPGLSNGALELITCMAELLRRLPENADLVPLETQEVNQLLNWEAEVYRQSLDRETA